MIGLLSIAIVARRMCSAPTEIEGEIIATGEFRI